MAGMLCISLQATDDRNVYTTCGVDNYFAVNCFETMKQPLEEKTI